MATPLMAKSRSLRYRHLRFRLQYRGVCERPMRVASAHPCSWGVCGAVALYHVLGRVPLTVARHQMSRMRGRTTRVLAQ